MHGDKRGASGLAALVIILVIAVVAAGAYIAITQSGFLKPRPPTCSRTIEAHVTVQGPGTPANNTTVRVFYQSAERANATTNANGTASLSSPCGVVTVIAGGGAYLDSAPVVVDTEATGRAIVPVYLSVQPKP